ncbi:beta-3-deoxy-D-manno-oct-2-ulosonic acid transferase [uncultured Sphingomonas sp.]|uniref:capsular polysaccharide export protein, LipB/KpsS family n=1 Tax=uncultured Sphingomonas sp. TaxID=158754 RepID=UPI0035CBA11D
MTAVRQPLLRSPPFPGLPVAVAAVAAVSGGGAPLDPATLEEERVEAVLGIVRDARVGAAFWAAPAGVRAATVVRVTRSHEPGGVSADALRVPASLKELTNPWSLLAPGVTLVAQGDDEWAGIGELAGAAVRIVSSGRFGAPGETQADRRHRIAAHLLGCRYRDPFTGEECRIDQAVALLALWRRQIDADRDIVAATGMAWWKRAAIRRFLWAPRPTPLRFLRGPAAIRHAARAGGAVAIWPSRVSAATLAEAGRRAVPLVEVEDGFVRSVGLGANLVPPQSVVVDRSGIHYDPARPSELERLIEGGDFPPALLARAAALRARLVAGGIGKYGGAGDQPALPPRRGRRLVLVPGQVEDDRSVLLGGGQVTGNLDLLRRVRSAEPEAEIWYRPHPDVDAGHRRGGLRDADALVHADRVLREGSMAALLGHVDAVHVLTSLTGFEALLRGREVTCHGVPFFAGWGLTRDLGPMPARRSRDASLDELVAATLILYPRYLDPVTRLPCPAEVLVARIEDGAMGSPGLIVRLRRWQGRLLGRRR